MDPKEIFMAEHDRLIGLLEDEGVPYEEAYDRTGDAAYRAMQDRFADEADNARQRAKDGSL